MSTATKTKKSDLSEFEAIGEEFGYLRQFKSTAGGRSNWSGMALSIQAKKSQRLGVSAVIWIDRATCDKNGIDLKQPGLRFDIFNDDRRVMIETIPSGSSDGVKAIIHPNAICINWHSVPESIRRDKQLPKALTEFKASHANGVTRFAWTLPEWFFGGDPK